MRLAKKLFSSLRLPTHWEGGLEGGRRGDTRKEMLFAPSHWVVLHLFFLVLMRMKFMQFEAQGIKDGVEQSR